MIISLIIIIYKKVDKSYTKKDVSHALSSLQLVASTYEPGGLNKQLDGFWDGGR